MDIWAWAHDACQQLADAGQGVLAASLAQLPGVALNGPVEQVEVLVPQIVAASRALGQPWIEVYARHWHVQNRLCRRAHGEVALGDVVEVFEFANRDETRHCPQATCVTQDLAICFANSDEIGYAAERKAVAMETLRRIDPSWACFTCISREAAGAMVDLGAPDEAVAWYRGQLEATGVPRGKMGASETLEFAGLLASAGYFEESLEAVECGPQLGGALTPRNRFKMATTRSQALTGLGRLEEAQAVLLPFEDILEDLSGARVWVATVRALVEGGLMDNDAKLSSRLFTLVHLLAKAGSHRRTFEIACSAGVLAARRGAVQIARRLAALAEEQSRLLRSAEGVADKLTDLGQAIAVAEVPALPVPPAELLDYLNAYPQPPGAIAADTLLDWFAAARQAGEGVDITELSAREAALWLALGEKTWAAEQLWPLVEDDPSVERPAQVLMRCVLALGSTAALERFCALVGRSQPARAEWARACHCASQGAWQDCLEACEGAIRSNPVAAGARRLAARACEALGDFARATALLTEIIELGVATDQDHWARLTTASACSDWRTVRASAGHVGFSLPDSDEAVDVPMGAVMLQFDDGPGGRPERWLARRTGPATAVVVQVGPPECAQHHGDLVVFHPSPIEAPPNAGDESNEGTKRLLVFAPLVVARAAGRSSFSLRGAHPGLEGWSRLRSSLAERDWALWMSLEGTVKPTADGQEVKVALAYLSVPPGTELGEVDRELQRLTAGPDWRLAWPELAAAAGSDAASHLSTLDELGLAGMGRRPTKTAS